MFARKYRTVFLGSSALILLFALGRPAWSQDTNAPADTSSKAAPTGSQLPEIKVTAPRRKPGRRPKATGGQRTAGSGINTSRNSRETKRRP